MSPLIMRWLQALTQFVMTGMSQCQVETQLAANDVIYDARVSSKGAAFCLLLPTAAAAHRWPTSATLLLTYDCPTWLGERARGGGGCSAVELS